MAEKTLHHQFRTLKIVHKPNSAHTYGPDGYVINRSSKTREL